MQSRPDSVDGEWLNFEERPSEPTTSVAYWRERRQGARRAQGHRDLAGKTAETDQGGCRRVWWRSPGPRPQESTRRD